ncbi:Clc-like protein [Ancylostoma ceylanicum]|uniref:Clc-like protein n=1 Tax=Ancylostoma ceylanicum TaxID=53326 RepID=A0A0D6LAW0_9BILA|nr:Clc-like protein [Ancylostoma ceylanicum]
MSNVGLERCRLGIWILSIVADLVLLIGTLTPAWQVAEDTDVGRYVQSGLWLYCPGAAQCWYIFSDNLINYYERVDVCRFLLIGDCRKKLLRTPYFFGIFNIAFIIRLSKVYLMIPLFGCEGWHYAVLILNIVSICLISCGIAAAAWQYKNRERSRLSTILFSAFICMAVLTLGISLMVFVINGEMLESKYLIGVKNTFEKYYGYSFYLACTALVMLVFAAFGAILMTTFTFFGSGRSTDTAQRHISSVTSDYNEEIRKSPQQYGLYMPAKIFYRGNMACKF